MSQASGSLILFTDGSLENGRATIGMVLLNVVQSRAWWASSEVPSSWMSTWREFGVEHPICEVELLALVCALSLWSSELYRQRSLVFVDNNASLDAVIRNKSSSSAMRQLLCTFAELDSRVQWLAWYGRVPSHSNVADAPSRGSVPRLPEPWSLAECHFLWESLPKLDDLRADR